MGSNTPRLRVQAGAQGVDGQGHRDHSTLPQGAAPQKPPRPPAPSVSPESHEMTRGWVFTVAGRKNPEFRKQQADINRPLNDTEETVHCPHQGVNQEFLKI